MADAVKPSTFAAQFPALVAVHKEPSKLSAQAQSVALIALLFAAEVRRCNGRRRRWRSCTINMALPQRAHAIARAVMTMMTTYRTSLRMCHSQASHNPNCGTTLVTI
jgi:hypothetical protein